jgi:hypothetical protein
VSGRRALPSSAPEQPPNDLNVAEKLAPLGISDAIKGSKESDDGPVDKEPAQEDTPNDLNVTCNRNERLTPFTRSDVKKSEAVVVAQLNKTKREWTRKASADPGSRIIYCGESQQTGWKLLPR